MKIQLYLPLSDASDIILEAVKKYCNVNGVTCHAIREENSRPKMIIEHDSFPGLGIVDVVQTIVSYKKIRQFLLGNTKENRNDYFTDLYDHENWARKLRADPDEVRRFTGGAVIMKTPVHLLDDRVVALNPEKPERERIYRIKGSSKPYRKFDGNKNRHCSRCPFSDGCMVCTLP